MKTRELTSKISLPALFGSTHACVDDFCPITTAHRELQETGKSDPKFYALRYRAGSSEERVYELFLIHFRGLGASTLRLRMLPFPATMKLTIKDLPGVDPGLRVCVLSRLPSEIQVQIGRLFPATRFTFDDLEGVGQDLINIGRFLNELLIGIGDRVSPYKVWERAAAEFPLVSGRIPYDLARHFTEPPYGTPAQAQMAIQEIWSYVLDAPVLTTFVYPEILNRLRNDTDLLLASDDPFNSEDRAKYYRLHLSIEDLENQDEYLDWLPAVRDSKDERNTSRDEFSGGD